MVQRLSHVYPFLCLPLHGNASLELGPALYQTQDEQHLTGSLTYIFLDPEPQAPGLQGSPLITVLSVPFFLHLCETNSTLSLVNLFHHCQPCPLSLTGRKLPL